MNRYLEIQGKKFSLEEVASRLGITSPDKMFFCQKVEAGTIKVNVTPWEDDPFPGVDVELHLSNGSLPFPLARIEQESNTDAPVKAYLYNRTADSYVAYVETDMRTDEEFEDDPSPSSVFISGDMGETLEVHAENPHYAIIRGDFK